VRLISDCAASQSLHPVPDANHNPDVRQMLEDTKQQIEQMHTMAASEIEAQREQIYAEALNQARRELQAEFESLVDASFERFNMIVANAKADQDHIVHAAERDLVEIAIAIAHEALGDSPSEGAIERRVREGLNLLTSSEVTTILLHPDDLALVSPWIEQWQQAEGVQVEIVPDRTVEPGGCNIVARSAIYDFGPQARLQMIADALRDRGNGD
jgi:flagellar biosynthesis/type III secretory pathway protein FliH